MQELIKAYNHKDVIGVCKDIGGRHWEDVRGEVVAKILWMPEEEREKINNMVAYMVRLCYNYAQDLYKKKETRVTVLTPNFDDCFDTEYIDNKIRDKVLDDCNSTKRFFNARVWVFSNQAGSVKAFSRTTTIPYRYLIQAYREYREYLQNWIKDND